MKVSWSHHRLVTTERDELREQVRVLREALKMSRQAHVNDGWPIGWNVSRLDEALAATEKESGG